MGGPLFLLFRDPIAGLISIASLIIALTIHEFSHAKVADALGDPTPRLEGRVSLNPKAHLDPLGTLLILLVGFGWGKPVRYDAYNLENPRVDGMKIALAGPASNIALALAVSIIYKLMLAAFPTMNMYLNGAFVGLISLNIYLAIFNLLPVEPLDGFKVVAGLLPRDQAEKWQTLAPFGMFILLFLIFIPPAPGIRFVMGVSSLILNFLL
ncbi:MAG: site-2 protease family protein [Patescibacteria group bacterium]